MFYLPPEQDVFQPYPREARTAEILNVLSALSGAIFFVLFFLVGLTGQAHLLDPMLLWPLLLATMVIPPYRRAYGFCSKDYTHELKLNFARVASWSCFVLFNSLAAAQLHLDSRQSRFGVIAAILYCLPAAALLLFCTKKYFAIHHPHVKWDSLLIRVAIGFFVGVLELSAVPSVSTKLAALNESHAIRALKAISLAERQYVTVHPSVGFAPSLELLGPQSTGTVDWQLALRQEDAYEFCIAVNNIPGNVAQSPRFILTARPRIFRRGATRSFYTDESSIIHFTTEDRPATIQDPVLN